MLCEIEKCVLRLGRDNWFTLSTVYCSPHVRTTKWPCGSARGLRCSYLAFVVSSPALVPFFPFQGCYKVVTATIPRSQNQGCSQVVTTLSQTCSKVVTVSIYKYLTMSEHGSYNLVTSLWYKVVTSLWVPGYNFLYGDVRCAHTLHIVFCMGASEAPPALCVSNMHHC